MSAPRVDNPALRVDGWRLGLCCTFLREPIRFRTTTARYLRTMAPGQRLAFLRQIALDNAAALSAALSWCLAHGVGAFRVRSELLPLYTHPEVGYTLAQLDDGTGDSVSAAFRRAGEQARRGGLRLSFHPDQFVVPGSASPAVARMSLRELEYQSEVAGLIGADQITIHGGGAQGGKPAALERLAHALDRLSEPARRRVVLENDDRVYTPADLLPVCRRAGLPMVYDLHHHRVLPDGMPEDEALAAAAATWRRREPWVHISSPLGGWRAAEPRRHADLIRPSDVPSLWRGRRMTVDVEAKAKEIAVLRLRAWLEATSRRP